MLLCTLVVIVLVLGDLHAQHQEGGPVAIDWTRTERQLFERIVEALLHRLYDGAERLEVIDGRGGDGGRDVVVVQGQRRRIFQLKHFVDGFSTERRSRRNQIMASFEAALAHNPTEWTLVVPCNLTPGERTFVEGLAGRASDGGAPHITVMDRAALDQRLANVPDLMDYFTRDEHLLEQARVYNQERMLLLGGVSDLTHRVSALGVVTDACDPDWTVDFARQGGQVVHTLRAKHALAHQVSPITLSVAAELGPQEVDLREAVRRSLGFGTPGTLTLPASAVRSWRVEGPSWLREDRQHVEVSFTLLVSDPLPGERMELRFTKGERTTSLHEGVLEHVGTGDLGLSLQARFHGAAVVSMLIPEDRSAPTRLQYSVELLGADPAAALRAIALSRAFHGDGQVELFVDGQALATLDGRGTRPEPEHPQWLEDWELLASDLDAVQRHCGAHFAIPQRLSTDERVQLRVARLLLDGRCVIHPQAQVLRTALTGEDSPQLRQVIDGSGHTLRLDCSLRLTIGHRVLELGPVTFFSARAVVRDHASLTTALDEHMAADRPLVIEVQDGGHFRCFMPDRQKAPGEPLVASPWGLAGVDEPHDLAAG